MKIKTLVSIIGILAILPTASCWKSQRQMQEKTATAKLPAVMFQSKVDPNSVFSLTRSGQIVKVQWHVDFSGCKYIVVVRNKTGITKDRYDAARFEPNIQEYVDELPDASAYWYWLRVIKPSGEGVYFGPIRVAPDTGNTGVYSKVSDSYQWGVQRTHTTATILWNFPNQKYRHITIKRNSSQSPNKRTDVYSTLEWSDSYVDTLPDPEGDYWYWIEAQLGNGTLITQGPSKANYVSN